MAAIIPLTDIRATASAAARDAFVRAAANAPVADESSLPVDVRRRPLHDLRISVTDRCNFRCVYCMPKDVYGRDFPFLPHADLLTFEEIARIAKVFVGRGVRKIRLTGGEPLLRRNLERLIAMLAAIGDVDITLTTNGALLARKARALRDAGLNRVTVSLDALDDPTFRAMNDVDFPVARVLEGIDAAHAAGSPRSRSNGRQARLERACDRAARAALPRQPAHIVRFIEYMDVGHTNGWRMDHVVPAAEIVDRIDREFPLEPVDRELSRRGRATLALSQRRQRGRRHRVGDAGLLPRVHARTAVHRRQALHLPVCRQRLRPARIVARRVFRRAGRQRHRRDLACARRSLFRDPHGEHAARVARRDVVHRRLALVRTLMNPHNRR